MVCSLLSEGIGHTPAHGLVLARFNDVPFMIYDEAHRMAGIYDGSGWQLVSNRRSQSP